jgi:hypothetical protein
VYPSTSKSPFASIAPVKVETPTTLRVPDTLTSSSSVYPSTSKSPLASIAPVKVEIPLILTLVLLKFVMVPVVLLNVVIVPAVPVRLVVRIFTTLRVLHL